ncbi:conserved hypothetical protein [Xenorhabdus innexi]|uniref:N-acetyltransferase domain-containing protein n=1 Tax=Xenorhabdus innexi TaxID=290109 RepID=A0A1N6MWK9_9GAMM|nr:GNAT family N-acetyltransferase [Xenorhabdus innexi]PHM36572.1 hypothetical protein Xinn_01515 [Xenorhabdus innexi]SIP73119.1 conserved hypothetical protein [Xenorhabdus innexi]
MNNNILPVTVKFVAAEHYSQWLVYWQAYQDFYQVNLSNDVTEKTWARFFDAKEPMYCAVALAGDKILGFVHYLYHRSTWSEMDFCYLEDLFVSPEARGHHIGKQLIEFVQCEARKQNCGRLYWHTHETNLRAQHLYDWVAEKSGMIEYRMAL